LFKVFFLFIVGTIAFALFVAVIALIFGGIAWWPVNNFLWTSKWQQLYTWGTIIFFLAVPLIGIYNMVDTSYNWRPFQKQLSRMDICVPLVDWMGCRCSLSYQHCQRLS
jgi:hypothetical protein